MDLIKCRFCGSPLHDTFVNLGTSPLANAYLKKQDLQQMEHFYPLQAYVCKECFLVQLAEIQNPEQIFTNYAYFSSYSDSWLKHARDYVNYMIERFGFDSDSQVIEIGSNDGYLLRYFKEKDIPVLGIEPAGNVAEVALAAGIPTVVEFFGIQSAMGLVNKGIQADLLLGNNVLAHVPDLNGFVKGLKILLNTEGIITMEFPHLLELMTGHQFDTVYHEHFSYFSLLTVEKIFARHGLALFDVEKLKTHGGSIRIHARHAEKCEAVSVRVQELKEKELQAGLNNLQSYAAFAQMVRETKWKLLKFLITARQEGKSIAGYGAPAKGNTLLNFCGIGIDIIDYTVDISPHKQGCYLPGTRIPIYSPGKVKETKPDYLLILPWNLKDEIINQMAYARQWGCKFVVPIPQVEVIA